MNEIDPNGELAVLYLSECDQQLRRFEQLLLSSDADGALCDPAEMFRLLHTLKGSSAMMEYAPLVDAAHRFENILATVKGAERPPQGESLRRLIDVGLDFSTYFQGQLSRLRAGKAPEANEALCATVDALAAALGVAKSGGAPAPAHSEAPKTPLQAGARRAAVTLRSCPLPNIRAFLVARSVEGLCTTLCTDPVQLDRATDRADAIRAEGFRIDFTPAPGVTADDVLRKLAAQPYVASCVLNGPPDAKPDEAPDAIPAQNVTVAQAVLNELIGRLDEIASAESAVEACAEETGLDAGPLHGRLAALRRAVADASVLAASLGSHDVGSVFLQMQRTVRSMAKDLKKPIRVKTAGADVQVDKSILEILSDSLIHMVRNAVDHGIEPPERRAACGKPETGLITLEAVKRNEYLIVTVSDDGGGIRRQPVLERAAQRGKLKKPAEQYTDAEVGALLLSAGVSTKDEVTQYSGRGVGLDTVVRRVRQAGGRVGVESREGVGTTFRLTIPTTLVILEGMQLQMGDGSELILPANAVRHVEPAPAADRIDYRGELYTEHPFPGAVLVGTDGYALLLERDFGPFFIRAKQVSRITTYYVKPMPPFVADAMGRSYLYSGCVFCADAKLRCVLDPGRLIGAAEAAEYSERQAEQ